MYEISLERRQRVGSVLTSGICIIIIIIFWSWQRNHLKFISFISQIKRQRGKYTPSLLRKSEWPSLASQYWSCGRGWALGLPVWCPPPLLPLTFSYSISKSQSFFQVLCSPGSDHPGTAQFLLILKGRVFLARLPSRKGEGKVELEGHLRSRRKASWFIANLGSLW